MNKNAKRHEWENKKPIERRPLNIKEYRVKEECELLQFLLETFKGTSRNNIKMMLKNRCVAVDGAPIGQFDFKLAKGDIVIVSKTSIRPKNKSKLPIIYEDSEFIVIDKPYGILSVASDKEKANTAYRMVMEYVQEKDKHNRIFVVHRIDRETSGVLMFCKNEQIRNVLQEKWNDVVTKRGYYAIVEGSMTDKTGTIKSYLKMNSLNMMYVTKNPKDFKTAQFCVTNYKVMKENEKFSLLDVNIDSGRKNQIRVQLGSLGHYIIGDDKYGEPEDPLKRLGLHAYGLSFIHPLTGKKYSFTAKMPKEFETMFNIAKKTINK